MSALRVYVACSSRELERAKWAIASLREAGVEVTHDWPAVIEANGGVANGSDPDDRVDAARDCLDGVARADLLWLLVPRTESAGCYVELGYAIRLRDRACVGDRGRRILASGPERMRSVMCSLAEEYDDDRDALAEILRYRPEVRT